MSTSSQKRAEEYREKAANFKKLKAMFTVIGVMDLVLAVIWFVLFLRKSPDMEFAQAYKNEPLFLWLSVFFIVIAILSWLLIPLMKKLTFKGYDGEDMVE